MVVEPSDLLWRGSMMEGLCTFHTPGHASGIVDDEIRAVATESLLPRLLSETYHII